MPRSREAFVERWRHLPEDQTLDAIDAAWRRYQLVQDSYVTEAAKDDPSRVEFQDSFKEFLPNTHVRNAIQETKFGSLPANKIPWTSSGFHLKRAQTVSTFASGRVWRSRELDLWLRSQFALWFKVGVSGIVFNSTRHTNTFQAQVEGELYVANHFPGRFGEPAGGDLSSPLLVHANVEGHFEILVVVWKAGVDVSGVLEQFLSSSSTNRPELLSQELERIRNDPHSSVPKDWRLLWFLGTSSIYSLQSHEGQPCMHCNPYLNVGILQKNLTPAIQFEAQTKVSRDWLVSSIPSRLREDMTFTHDYLSVAFEFENGRDLSYTWSWKLPRYTGYWCPLPTWADREYHVVIRSGTGQLGKWLIEERNLYADYVQYVEGGREDTTGLRMPRQVVRAWVVAGNRWQKFDGEMMVKNLRITRGNVDVNIL